MKTYPLFKGRAFWHAAASDVFTQHKSQERWQRPPLLQRSREPSRGGRQNGATNGAVFGRDQRPTTVRLAENIAAVLGDSLGKISLSNFPDGEISVRIEEDVRGRDVYVVQPTCPPVNENLVSTPVLRFSAHNLAQPMNRPVN